MLAQASWWFLNAGVFNPQPMGLPRGQKFGGGGAAINTATLSLPPNSQALHSHIRVEPCPLPPAQPGWGWATAHPTVWLDHNPALLCLAWIGPTTPGLRVGLSPLAGSNLWMGRALPICPMGQKQLSTTVLMHLNSRINFVTNYRFVQWLTFRIIYIRDTIQSWTYLVSKILRVVG